MEQRSEYKPFLRDPYSPLENGLPTWSSFGMDPSFDDNFFIGWASKRGYLGIVQWLLTDKRVDPSANDNYAIRRASENGHVEVVRLLLADPRVHSLKLKELTKVQDIIITYLFQRYRYLIMVEAGRDILQFIIPLVISA